MSPIDVYSMTPDEVMAEANRRREAREQGIKLEQHVIRQSHAAIDRDQRKLEKEIQSVVVKTYRAFGFKVYTTSQPKRSMMSPGIADVYATHPRRRVTVWHETKTINGHLSPDQVVFREDCLAANQLHTYGGVSAAEEMLETLGIASRVGVCLESISPVPE